MAAIGAESAASAVIVTDAAAVAAHYLQSQRRPDLAVSSLSTGTMSLGRREAWVIVQDEHATFENRLLVEQLRAREKPWTEIRAGDRLAAQVFRITRR